MTMLLVVFPPRVRIGLYVFATLACLLALGWLAADVSASGERVYGEVARRVEAIASELESREVILRAEGESFAIPWSELGYQVDRRETARKLLLTEAPKTRWQLLRERLTGASEPSDAMRIVWQMDAVVGAKALRKWAARLRVEPRDAVLDFERHGQRPEQWGREVDVDATLVAAATLAPPFDDQLELSFDALPPRVTLAVLPQIDPRKILARYDTDFRKKRGPRIHNIRAAAAYLNGSVIAPGEILSFNRTVGARVAERGFIEAPVIVNDVMESGMGGGVCQVATALHAAAIFGGLDVVERRSHSRPSGYAPLGLDATVLDGVQDLRIRNPYDRPIYVRAYLPSRYVARVELLGVELAGTVNHRFWVSKRHDYTRRIVTKSELAPGTFERAQKGGFGYDAVSVVTHVQPNGERTTRRYASKYYPVPEVLLVAPGTKSTNLPPLPKGATARPERDIESEDDE
jgi:vancomycin resistance protein YoaR